MKATLSMCAALFCAGVFAAETVFDGSAAGVWTATPKAASEAGAIMLPGQLMAKAFFTIDPAKSYQITGEFRCTDGDLPKMWIYAGFQPKDAGDKVIAYREVGAVTRELAEVAETAAVGAKEVKLRGADKWKIPVPYYYIALNAKVDRSDLPNRDLIQLVKNGAAAPADGVRAFALKSPLAKAIPAGTKVRLQSAGESFQFVSRQSGKSEWTPFKCRKLAAKSAAETILWYPGAVKARVIFYVSGQGKVELRNVKCIAE